MASKKRAAARRDFRAEWLGYKVQPREISPAPRRYRRALWRARKPVFKENEQ
jgi:hypothetical protein